MAQELYDYQASAFTHLNKWKVGALFMEAGTGKTRVARELINSVKDTDYLLWVGPLQTVRRTDGSSVVDEINKWGGFDCKNVDYVGIESIQASDRIALLYHEKLSKAKCAFVVVDESLKIKNYEAKRTKRLIEYGKLAKYKLILNGTPITRNVMDVWAQMEFLSPRILNMSMARFKNTFCKYTTVTKSQGYYSYKREFITGYDNIDYLYSLIGPYVYECDLNLNIAQNYHERSYYIDEDSYEEYKYLKEKYLDDEMLMMKNNNIFLEMTQKMQHIYCCTENKFEKVEDILSNIDPKKTIIFCKYVDSREKCKKRFPDCLVLSYQKESLGLNLQGYCNTIYFDKIWDLALRVQSGRRTFRTGQKDNCQYYDLTGDVGLESLIDRCIQKKVTMSEYFKKVSKEQLKKDL